MAKDNSTVSFWLSYSDLMTSLFFIMLVLFVVCMAKMKIEVDRAKIEVDRAKIDVNKANAEKKQLERILRLDEQFKGLTKSEELQYDEERKMFVAKDFVGVEIFNPNSADIKPEFDDKVRQVGWALQEVVKRLHTSSPEVAFQLVIEGNAAIDYRHMLAGTYNPDNVEMYRLSYDRALALYLRWQSDGIDLRQYNTEVIIAGSGFNGKNRDPNKEENNKRFVIQIIPKVSRPQ